MRSNEEDTDYPKSLLLHHPKLMALFTLVITDPDDSRFDLEAYLNMKAAE